LALAHWIINVAPTLPDGRYDIELPNTALTCIGVKESDRPARVVIRARFRTTKRCRNASPSRSRAS
jgi:hypothetical protein